VALTQLSEQDTLSVEDSINRFIASIIPVHQMGAIHANDRHNLIVVHTLVQAALIRLYYLRGEVDQLWNEKCLHAARGMLLVIGQVSEMDIEFLDPIVGVSLPGVLKSLVAYQLENDSVAGPRRHKFLFVRSLRWSPGRRLHRTNLGPTLGPSQLRCRDLV
jgi:hypothetical protein